MVTVRTADGKRRDFLLDRFGSPESKDEYRRMIDSLTAGVLPPTGPIADLTVAEVLLRYVRFATDYYRDAEGEPTSEVNEVKASVKIARVLYGPLPAAEFGPRKMAAVRDKMIALGWSRKVINQRAGRVRRAFKWAVAEELVPPAVYEGLHALVGLKAGRTAARESTPIKPVLVELYEATVPHLNRVPRAVAEFMRWTGCRPAEACRLTLAEVNRTGDVWLYRPVKHKTRHHDKTRTIPVGPRAQAVIMNFLAGRLPAPAVEFDPSNPASRLHAADAYAAAHRPADAELLRDLSIPVEVFNGCVLDPTAPLFNPARDRMERFAEMRKGRRSKVQPSQLCRKKAKPKKVPGSAYRPSSLHHAIEQATEAAGLPHWHPNQLRHLRATEVRAKFGLEHAQVLLGHARADVTQIYAERNEDLAATVAAAIG